MGCQESSQYRSAFCATEYATRPLAFTIEIEIEIEKSQTFRFQASVSGFGCSGKSGFSFSLFRSRQNPQVATKPDFSHLNFTKS